MKLSRLIAMLFFSAIFFRAVSIWAVMPPLCEDLDTGEDWICVGEYIYPNGDIYYGEFKNHYGYKNGIPYGWGDKTNKDGTSFTGLFKNGQLNGFARKLSSQGKTVMEGIFENNIFIGEARKLLYQEEVDSFQQQAIKEVFDSQINDKDCQASGVICARFRTINVDLNVDGFNEIIVMQASSYWCGSGGCYSYILSKDQNEDYWKILDSVFGADWSHVLISSKMTESYYDIYLGKYKCVGGYKCSD